MRSDYRSFIFVFISVLVLTTVKCSNSNGGGIGNANWQKKNSCKQVEAISRKITWQRVAENPVLPAKLIRMQFHDCFVRGCDGSILLDSTAESTAEKEAIPNLSLIGFEVIDEIKAEVEKQCPGQVSCADILALAARDAVSFQFKLPLWPVFIGRKDGRISLASEANRDLPSPFANFATLQQQFKSNGLNTADLVALSGAHTIGLGHCVIILNRLFNYSGNGDIDPSLNATYAEFLKQQCQDFTATAELDPGSSLSFDTNYFVALNQKKGFFESDATLLTNPEAARFVTNFQNPRAFFAQFAQSMVKMSAIGGNEGEIRKNCRVVN